MQEQSKSQETIVDYFETEDRIVTVVHRHSWSLREVIVECYPNGTVSCDAARMIILSLATTIRKMKSMRVIHIKFCLDSIIMRISKSEPCGYSVKKISGMKYATDLK